MRSLFGNLLYTDVADFPRFMSDERWLKGASLLMREAGIEQYLVNMLYLPRNSPPGAFFYRGETPTLSCPWITLHNDYGLVAHIRVLA